MWRDEKTIADNLILDLHMGFTNWENKFLYDFKQFF